MSMAAANEIVRTLAPKGIEILKGILGGLSAKCGTTISGTVPEVVERVSSSINNCKWHQFINQAREGMGFHHKGLFSYFYGKGASTQQNTIDDIMNLLTDEESRLESEQLETLKGGLEKTFDDIITQEKSKAEQTTSTSTQVSDSTSTPNPDSPETNTSGFIITDGYKKLLNTTTGFLPNLAVPQTRALLQIHLSNLSEGISWQDAAVEKEITSFLTKLKDPDLEIKQEDITSLKVILAKFNNATLTEKSHFDDTRKVHVATNETIFGLVEGLLNTVNSSPVISTVLGFTGVNLGKEAKGFLEKGLTSNFKNCMLKAMEGKNITDSDSGNLTDLESNIFVGCKFGILIGRWLPKGIIKGLIGLSETQTLMNIPFIGHKLNAVVRKLTAPICMIKPLLLPLDQMHTLIKDLSSKKGANQ